MITFFNRKLILSTMDADRYSNARDDLAAAGIKFTVTTKGQNTRHTVARTYTGTGAAAKAVSGMIYDIYVHEKDYSKAKVVINKKGGF